jgi:hypothetical protein
MKTKSSIIICLLIFISTSNMNAQAYQELSQEQLQKKVESYKSMKTTGMVMTFIGIPALVAGAVLYVNWVVSNTNYSSNSSIDSGGAVGGLVLMVVRELMTVGGIVLWSIGGNKSKKYQRKLDESTGKLSLKSGKYGVGLVYRF